MFGIGGTVVNILKPINSNEANSRITADMPENEREPILKNTYVTVSDATKVVVPKNVVDIINSGNYSEAYKAIKNYANENIEVNFNFSGESYNKSKSEQRIRGNSLNDFLLMINNFNNIVKNAQLLEMHSDRINDGALKNTIVLISAFWNGYEVVPVEIEIKEYRQMDTEPKLYMAVTINKKDDAVKYTGSPLGPHAIAPPFNIS